MAAFVKNSLLFKNVVVKNAFKSMIINQQVRFYPRWNHRRPAKVYTPEEYEQLIENKKHDRIDDKDVPNIIPNNMAMEELTNTLHNEPVKSSEQIKSPESDRAKLKVVTKEKKKPQTDMLEMVFDSGGNFIYTKMKNKDPRISDIIVNLRSKKEMAKNQTVLLEGKRLIRDALEAHCRLKYLLFTRPKEVQELKPYLPKSGVRLYKMPYKEMQLWSDLTTAPGIMGVFETPDVSSYKSKDALPLTVICDNIREPGNLGAVLRSCAGVGCERVILTKGCVNLWDSKVLRSSAGCHFRLQIHSRKTWDDIKTLVEPTCDVFVADNKTVVMHPNHTDLKYIIESSAILPYYSVDFSKCRHIVLIVGGETEGICEESYKYVYESCGSRLNVPLSNDVDSLNTGAALGIIAFEIKRQLLITKEDKDCNSLNN